MSRGPSSIVQKVPRLSAGCWVKPRWSQQELGIAIGLTLARPPRARRRARVTCWLCFSLRWDAMLVQWREGLYSVVYVKWRSQHWITYDREYECHGCPMSPQNSLDMCSQQHSMRLLLSQYYYTGPRRVAMMRCLPQLSRNLSTCSTGVVVGHDGWHHQPIGRRFDDHSVSDNDHLGVSDHPIVLSE